MIRTSRKQRFAMVAVSGAFVAGGVLLPGAAFAATSAAVHQADHAKGGHQGQGQKDHRGEQKGHHGEKNQRGKKDQHGRKGEVRDVENMPGCKFYQGKVYCEHQPNPAPKPAPAPQPDPADAVKENPDHVPNVR